MIGGEKLKGTFMNKVKIRVRLMTKIILGSLFILFSCGCRVESDYNSAYKNERSNLQVYFTDSLLHHIPEETLNPFRLISVFPERCPMYNRCGVIILLKHDESYIANLKRKYGLKDLLKINFLDSCNLIVNKHDSIVACREYLNSISNCKKLLLPIPDLDRIVNNSKTIVKPESINLGEYDIFVLEASPGHYINDKFLSNGQCMPNEWRNGFSRGLAINEQNSKVIYWLEIW